MELRSPTGKMILLHAKMLDVLKVRLSINYSFDYYLYIQYVYKNV
jgi:hypothetical protein